MKRVLFIIICLVWSFAWSYSAIKFAEYRELINLVYTNIILLATLPLGGVAVKREVVRLFF
jgi:hypothetical protein